MQLSLCATKTAHPLMQVLGANPPGSIVYCSVFIFDWSFPSFFQTGTEEADSVNTGWRARHWPPTQDFRTAG